MTTSHALQNSLLPQELQITEGFFLFLFLFTFYHVLHVSQSSDLETSYLQQQAVSQPRQAAERCTPCADALTDQADRAPTSPADES